MKQTIIFTYDSTEPQPEQVEENPIFNYIRSPKPQNHSKFARLGWHWWP